MPALVIECADIGITLACLGCRDGLPDGLLSVTTVNILPYCNRMTFLKSIKIDVKEIGGSDATGKAWIDAAGEIAGTLDAKILAVIMK